MIILINKQHIFNEQQITNFEMVPYENYKEDTLYIERKTFQYFEMLQEHLKVDNIEIDIIEAYKSLEYVENEFCQAMKKYGIEKANTICDMPGFSDFHTGQAIEFVIKKNNNWLNKEESKKEIKKLKKIHKTLPLFGFIIRYPLDKEHITEHPYNPLHIRYVGREISHKIKNLSLEEYCNNNE